MTEGAHPTWRLPPAPALLVALLLIACAEISGASMVRFKLELARWARGTMLARPWACATWTSRSWTRR